MPKFRRRRRSAEIAPLPAKRFLLSMRPGWVGKGSLLAADPAAQEAVGAAGWAPQRAEESADTATAAGGQPRLSAGVFTRLPPARRAWGWAPPGEVPAAPGHWQGLPRDPPHVPPTPAPPEGAAD